MKSARKQDSLRTGLRQVLRRKDLTFFAAGLSCYLFFGLATARAQQPKPNEYQVKAAYLYNFGRFVAWPAGAESDRGNSFAICVLGEDPFGTALDATIANQSIDGKDVVAKRLSKAEEASDCRILFISSSEKERLKEILEAVDKAGVLTVSDDPDFSQRGGMIQFVLDQNKVRFEVNLTNAGKAGLVLSSDLLKVAVAVRKNP